jgi:hypothetical protein
VASAEEADHGRAQGVLATELRRALTFARAGLSRRVSGPYLAAQDLANREEFHGRSRA